MWWCDGRLKNWEDEWINNVYPTTVWMICWWRWWLLGSAHVRRRGVSTVEFVWCKRRLWPSPAHMISRQSEVIHMHRICGKLSLTSNFNFNIDIKQILNINWWILTFILLCNSHTNFQLSIPKSFGWAHWAIAEPILLAKLSSCMVLRAWWKSIKIKNYFSNLK